MVDKIKIFIGGAPFGADAESQMVVEYSIRKNTTADVDIVWMRQSFDPKSPYFGWDSDKWGTPFSAFRWSIPEVCGYEGKAIYLDSDFIILSDIKDLWDQEFEDGKVVMAKGPSAPARFCISMWNNAAAKDWLPPIKSMRIDENIHKRMIKLFQNNQELVQPFQGNWNCVDGGNNVQISDIDGLHFSNIPTQPQLKYAIPRLKREGSKHWYNKEVKQHSREDLLELFDQYYEEALSAGYELEDFR